jgi:DNA-binding NarL/FixJ family response regulator
VALLAPTRGRLEHARALRVLAGLVAADEAVPLLRAGADLAWTCGATPDYDGIVSALGTLGEPPPPLPAAATRLTTWERDVLTRHLGGASERDIAEALFLAPVTVRAMLGTAREILGVNSRAELRSALRAG